MRALLALAAVALASPALPGGAEPAAGAASEAAWAVVRAQLDVHLNGARAGESLVLLEAGDAWVAVADLEAYGLVAFGGTRRSYAGRECVSLRSLSPRLGFEIDERALALRLAAGPELLGRRELDLAPRRPAGTVEGGEASAFANYALQGTLSGEASAYGELAASAGPALLSSGFAVPAGGGFLRGLTSLTYDRPERLERWVAGDAAAALGGLGSGAVVGGLSFTRELSLDPYLAQAPRPATTAFAATPSTLEVYVDGALVRRQAIAPGTLDLTNLPVVAGTSAVRTVVRDAYGREQVYDARALYTPGLLAPGRSDFGYHVGFLRDAAATTSFGYGRAVLLGRHRLGLGDAVTAGGRFEGALDRAMGGPTLTIGTVLGQLDLELAGSVARARGGAAASAAWSFTGRAASGGLRLRGNTRRFATATLELETDRALADASAFASVSVARRLGLGLEATASRWRDAGDGASVTARADLALGAGLTVLASLTRAVGGAVPGLSGTVMLSWGAGARTTAQVSASSGPAGPAATAGVQRSLPIGSGYGYRVEAASGAATERGSALLQWQTQFGRYEALLERTGPGSAGTATASGSVVLAGGRLFAARPLEQSYALLRVGVPGVRGYLENQEAGTTDAQGDLLVPSLQPRYANRVAIRAADLPLDYEVGAVEQLLAPPSRGCAVARFAVRPLRAITGRLVVAAVGEGDVVPAHGEVTVDGGAAVSPTTSEGRFFLERLAPGPHSAEVAWAGGTCRFALEVPDRGGLIDVGVVRCAPGPRVAGAEGDAPSLSAAQPPQPPTTAVGEPSGSTVTTTAAAAPAGRAVAHPAG